MGIAEATVENLEEHQKRVESLEEDHDTTKRLANNTDRSCNRALNFMQRMQLDNSAKSTEVKKRHIK